MDSVLRVLYLVCDIRSFMGDHQPTHTAEREHQLGQDRKLGDRPRQDYVESFSQLRLATQVLSPAGPYLNAAEADSLNDVPEESSTLAGRLGKREPYLRECDSCSK